MYQIKKNYYTVNTFDHDGLAALLNASEYRWILSYNDTRSVRKMYHNKSTLSLPISYTYYTRDKRACISHKTELIVCNNTIQNRAKVRNLFHKDQRPFGTHFVQTRVPLSTS